MGYISHRSVLQLRAQRVQTGRMHMHARGALGRVDDDVPDAHTRDATIFHINIARLACVVRLIVASRRLTECLRVLLERTHRTRTHSLFALIPCKASNKTRFPINDRRASCLCASI